MIIKKYKTCGMKYKDCECCLQYTNVEDDLTEYKCLWYNKNYQKTLMKFFKKVFTNTYKISKHHINKFILLFEKGAYQNECIDVWGKFNEAFLPEKKYFYSHLNMEDIIDVDFEHAKKSLSKFWNKRFRWIPWFVCSKRYIIVCWCICVLKCMGLILLIVEISIRGGIYHAFYWYLNANNKYMKDYDKKNYDKQSLYLNYWDVSNFYGWTKSQKLPLGGFKRAENTCQFKKNFIKKIVSWSWCSLSWKIPWFL